MAEAEPAVPLSRMTAVPVGVKPWQNGIAPHYIGLFLWIAWLDGLAVRTLPVGGLPASALGAAVAGGLCVLLLYYPTALWGRLAGEPLTQVATRTFGVAGSRWVPGLLMGLVQVGWFGVGVHYALDLTLRSLVTWRLADPNYLQPWIAAGGLAVRGPVYLGSALFWCVATALIGVWAMRLIAALMNAYPVFPALALGGAMVWAVGGLAGFRPSGIDPTTAEFVRDGDAVAISTMVQWTFAFFATAGVASVDWGAASRDVRDVRLGGLVGVAFAVFVLATITLVIVAGAVGRRATPPGESVLNDAQDFRRRAEVMRPEGSPLVERARRDVEEARLRVRRQSGADYSLATVFERDLGGRAGGLLLLLFGLGSLAPSVYASFSFGLRFSELSPRLARWQWTLLGTALAFPIVALGLPARPWTLFGLLGAAAAPVAGALAADFVRHRRALPAPRRGINPAGIAAWVVGFAVGLLPTIGEAIGVDPLSRAQPAAVFAFLAAFVVYGVVAMLGLESRPIEPDHATTQADQAGAAPLDLRSPPPRPSPLVGEGAILPPSPLVGEGRGGGANVGDDPDRGLGPGGP